MKTVNESKIGCFIECELGIYSKQKRTKKNSFFPDNLKPKPTLVRIIHILPSKLIEKLFPYLQHIGISN